MSHLLITGATGFIGQHLLNQLIKEHDSIRILSRQYQPIADTWKNHIEVAIGDLSNIDSLQQATYGVTAVCHLAGEIRDPSRMRLINVEGTRNLLNACKKNAVHHVIILSSVGVIGVRTPGDVDEKFPCVPLNEYEKSKYEAEQIALEWSARTGIGISILRPTIVFGENNHSSNDSMLSWLKAIKSGRFIFFDNKAVANYVYVSDVANACCHVLRNSAQGVFIVSDPSSLHEFVATAAEILRVPTPRLFIPLPLAYSAANILQSVWRDSPLTASRVRALSNRTRYIGRHIQRELGWQPSIGWREGLHRTIAWYTNQGKL